MASNSDYLEVPLFDEPAPDIWVKTVNGQTVSLKDVRSVVRYNGFWSFDYSLINRVRATAVFPSENVLMLSLIYREDGEEEQEED